VMLIGWIRFRTERSKAFRAVVMAALVAVIFSLLVGCGSTGKVQQRLSEKMLLGDYPGALVVVEEQKTKSFDGKNRLLYFLERGMLLHVDGQYEKSNVAFEEAKRIADQLYTLSLSNEGFSLVSSYYALVYAGEYCERPLIHLFSALNFILLDEPDSALVEIRQVGDYLRKLQVDSTNENVYQEDAFARYLSALLYESGGELDSAFVDYKKAAAAYRAYGSAYSVAAPPSLAPNAERVASRLGAWAQEDLHDRSDPVAPRVLPEGAGEVILLHYNGLSPIKSQDRYTIPFSRAWPPALASQAAVCPADR